MSQGDSGWDSESVVVSLRKKICLLIYVQLRWVFIAARGLFLVAESGGHTLIAALGQPFAVASLVAEYGPDVPGLQ